MLTIDGLVTGIDTTTVIDGLLQIQQRQIDQFDTRRNAVLREKTAFSGVESRLISLRGSLGKLNNIQRSALLGKVATSSDEDVLTAAASDNATPGVYTLHINSLAHAHQVASQGFAGQDAAITKGTLQLRTGSGSVTTITIDDSNDTLEGLADAINNSEASVNA